MSSVSSRNLSIVVPVFNESEQLLSLIEEIYRVTEEIDGAELLVIDDGSKDDSWQVLLAAAERWPQLRLARHLRNAGQSAAVLSGVRLARGYWVATLDGDGQNDPRDIARLLQLAQRDADPQMLLLAGQRIRRQDDRIKRWTSLAANRLRARLLRDEAPDSGCGLKLFRRQDYLSLPHFNHMHRYLPALFRRDGGRVVHLPVNHRPRRTGISKYGFWDRLWVGIADLLGVIWLCRRPCSTRVEERHVAD
jgi:dolichol-phosphate mannosyltransferase